LNHKGHEVHKWFLKGSIENLKPNFCATRSDSLKNGIESQDFGFGSGACAWSQG
jgi:hypothetical protein